MWARLSDSLLTRRIRCNIVWVKDTAITGSVCHLHPPSGWSQLPHRSSLWRRPWGQPLRTPSSSLQDEPVTKGSPTLRWLQPWGNFWIATLPRDLKPKPSCYSHRKQEEIANVCCFKLLNLGTFCYSAIITTGAKRCPPQDIVWGVPRTSHTCAVGTLLHCLSQAWKAWSPILNMYTVTHTLSAFWVQSGHRLLGIARQFLPSENFIFLLLKNPPVSLSKTAFKDTTN